MGKGMLGDSSLRTLDDATWDAMWKQELHERYYEPLAAVQDSLEAILSGPPVKKLLFMTDPAVIQSQIIPYWQVSNAGVAMPRVSLFVVAA